MKPFLPKIDDIIQAGINHKTGLPFRMDGGTNCNTRDNIYRQLKILDRQDAINRFTWFNTPKYLNSKLIERILYFKGQAILFYKEEIDRFFFLPYCLNGTIDVYGQYTGVSALPFAGGKTDRNGNPIPLFDNILIPQYDIIDEEEITDLGNMCVICKDYTPSIAETIIPRDTIQEVVLQQMSKIFPYSMTSLMANSGIKGIRVNSPDEESNVHVASKSIDRAAQTGEPWIPINATTEFQDLTNGNALKSEEYLIMMQALDNYRLSLYGLETGGLFQKKSHMLEAEQNMNSGHAKLALQDSLENRQRFCDIVNSIWNLGMYVEPSEAVLDEEQNNIIDEEDNNQNEYSSSSNNEYKENNNG